MIDRFKAGDISRITYKPTRDMESNYLTKTLQGKVFYIHHKNLMGLDRINQHMICEKKQKQ